MKSTGTTSWFHRDIPSARSPYTSTTWEDTKRQFVIESHHLGFDNKRKVNKKVTRKPRIIHMTSAIPKEERRYIKLLWQRQSSGSAVTDFQPVWQQGVVPVSSSKLSDQLNVPSYKHLAWSCSLQPTHSQRGEDTWLQVMPTPSDPLTQFKSH